jgi:hypothetical protein
VSLTESSFMECASHGKRKPTFICRHLQYGRGLGFFEEPAVDAPWLKQAWCAKCERVLDTISRIPLIGYPLYVRYSKPMLICEGCFEVIRSRNLQRPPSGGTRAP